jgi:hypothetical protein
LGLRKNLRLVARETQIQTLDSYPHLCIKTHPSRNHHFFRLIKTLATRIVGVPLGLLIIRK